MSDDFDAKCKQQAEDNRIKAKEDAIAAEANKNRIAGRYRS